MTKYNAYGEASQGCAIFSSPGAFLVAFFAVIAIAVLILVWPNIFLGSDHVGAIPSGDDYSLYEDFGGRWVPEIIDQELFYHNIGESVNNAKSSDIILLGPSYISYDFDQDTWKQEIEDHYHLKVYNMSFIGIRSGEFSRLVAERWNIRPRLWIINVDDQISHFFSTGLEMAIGPSAKPIAAVRHIRAAGFLNVMSTNLRWRVQEIWANLRQMGPARGIYRYPLTGQVDLSGNARFMALDNQTMKVTRNPDCHVKPETIAIGRSFVQSLRGRVILTLAPNSGYCPTQARELAEALGLELILSPRADYSAVDDGGHMDHKAAVEFTTFVASALAQTKTFQEILASRR